MSPSLIPFALGGTVIVLLSGIAATQAPLGAADDLREAIENLMASTTRDLNTGWLKPLDAYGTTRAGKVHEISLLARAAGFAESVDLRDLVVTSSHGGNVTVVEMSGVRDPDGSLASALLNGEDMVALVLHLTMPAARKDIIDLTLVPSDAAPLHISLRVPRTLAEERVRLDIVSVW